MGRRKGDGSVAKVLALQWGSPEFDAQDLCEKNAEDSNVCL